MAKKLELLFINSFIAHFFQMKDQFFSATFEASMKTFQNGSVSRISETLLFGISPFNGTKNTSILNTTIHYNLSIKSRDVPLNNF